MPILLTASAPAIRICETRGMRRSALLCEPLCFVLPRGEGT